MLRGLSAKRGCQMIEKTMKESGIKVVPWGSVKLSIERRNRWARMSIDKRCFCSATILELVRVAACCSLCLAAVAIPVGGAVASEEWSGESVGSSNDLHRSAACDVAQDLRMEDCGCDGWPDQTHGQRKQCKPSEGWIDDAMAQVMPTRWTPFQLDVLYTNDVMSNTRGGIRTGTVGKGLLDVVLRTDLSALGLEAIGGTLLLHGQNSHDQSLQSLVGATQSNNIDASPFTAMAEFYWEREYADSQLVTRVGRQVGAIQFSVLGAAADFLYGGFQLSPNNPTPWYPNPTVAVTANAQLTPSVDLGAGVFNGGPGAQLSPWGWSEEGSVFSLVELTYSHEWLGLSGDIQTGMWYTSANQVDPFGNDPYSDNHGCYFGIDQQLTREACDPSQGLAAFFIYSWAPSERNVVNQHYAAGAVYRGLIPSRDGDVTGFGFSTVDFSNELARPQAETIVEVFHKMIIGNSTLVQPAVQYVDNPSGVQRDAFVAGVRLGFEL